MRPFLRRRSEPARGPSTRLLLTDRRRRRFIIRCFLSSSQENECVCQRLRSVAAKLFRKQLVPSADKRNTFKLCFPSRG